MDGCKLMMAKVDNRGGDVEKQALCIPSIFMTVLCKLPGRKRKPQLGLSWPQSCPQFALSLSQTSSDHFKRFSVGPNQVLYLSQSKNWTATDGWFRCKSID